MRLRLKKEACNENQVQHKALKMLEENTHTSVKVKKKKSLRQRYRVEKQNKHFAVSKR